MSELVATHLLRVRSSDHEEAGEYIVSTNDLSDSDILIVTGDGCLPLVPEALRVLRTSDTKLVLMVDPKPAPTGTASNDGVVSSFGVPWRLARRHLSGLEPRDLCYSIVSAASSGGSELLPLRIIHRSRERTYSTKRGQPDIVVPHRGSIDFLDTAIRSAHTNGRVTVCADGLDVQIGDDLISQYPQVAFWRMMECQGPYVIRHHFAEMLSRPYFMFMDSDDISTEDRSRILLSEMEETAADMIGSHELRLDELSRKLIAVRYPLDVNDALAERARNAMLFPTTLISKQFYRLSGGLSTLFRYALDTQFILRCSMVGKLRNVDEFLYVRRVHHGSLTTAPQTGMANPHRAELDAAWKADFVAVKLGTLDLEESTLSAIRPTARQTPIRLGGA